jgi:hypothetical protein
VQQPAGPVVSPVHVPARLSSLPNGCEEPIFRSSVAPRRVRPFGWALVPLLLIGVALRRHFRRGGAVT